MLESANLEAVMLLIFIVTQRLGELWLARRNTAALMARGAVEHGQAHYPVMVGMHTVWVLALIVLGYDQPLHYGWLIFYGVLQIFRVWILSTLGERWTTRIIVLDEPLVVRGPFQFVKHPNYILVTAEVFVAPMVFGLWQIAALFTVLNAAMLYVRIGKEEKALAGMRQPE